MIKYNILVKNTVHICLLLWELSIISDYKPPKGLTTRERQIHVDNKHKTYSPRHDKSAVIPPQEGPKINKVHWRWLSVWAKNLSKAVNTKRVPSSTIFKWSMFTVLKIFGRCVFVHLLTWSCMDAHDMMINAQAAHLSCCLFKSIEHIPIPI